MSYERLAAIEEVIANPGATPPVVGVLAQPARISFYYPVEDVFDDSSLRSMYQSRNYKDAAGGSMVDDFAITEDERDIHLGLMEDAVYDVLLNFLKYTKAIENSIAHNESYTNTADTPVTENCSWVMIVDRTGFNENYLKAVDANILKAVRFYILRDWFSTQGKDTDAVKFDGLYTLALRNMKNYAFQLKKVKLT